MQGVWAVKARSSLLGLSFVLFTPRFPKDHWAAAWMMHLAAVLSIGGGSG